jgi:hypothetical protein
VWSLHRAAARVPNLSRRAAALASRIVTGGPRGVSRSRPLEPAAAAEGSS